MKNSDFSGCNVGTKKTSFFGQDDDSMPAPSSIEDTLGPSDYETVVSPELQAWVSQASKPAAKPVYVAPTPAPTVAPTPQMTWWQKLLHALGLE